MEKRRRDFFHRKAKKEGYRSRAAYKLLQACQRYHFINPGDFLLDLGCAPGGWLQIASKIVGLKGKVLGIDQKAIEPLEHANVRFMLSDVSDPSLPEKILATFEDRLNVVLADLSPNISGIWEVDHSRQVDLCNNALHITKLVLKPGGSFFTKIFDGPYLKEFISNIEQVFSDVKILKPKASRPESSELYVLGRFFQPVNA